VISLLKTELIKPWPTIEQVTLTTVEHVHWLNHR